MCSHKHKQAKSTFKGNLMLNQHAKLVELLLWSNTKGKIQRPVKTCTWRDPYLKKIKATFDI